MANEPKPAEQPEENKTGSELDQSFARAEDSEVDKAIETASKHAKNRQAEQSPPK